MKLGENNTGVKFNRAVKYIFPDTIGETHKKSMMILSSMLPAEAGNQFGLYFYIDFFPVHPVADRPHKSDDTERK